MRKISLFFYVLIIFLSLALLSISTVSIFAIKTISNSTYSELKHSMVQQGFIIHNELPTNGTEEEYREMISRLSQDVDARITFIDRFGKVIADSHEEYLKMENHSDRPEFQQALTGSLGSSRRLSSTLSENMLYIAIPPNDKALIVRMALSIEFIGDKVSKTYREIILFSLLILFVTIILGIITAKKFTQIIEKIKKISEHYSTGDFSIKLKENGPREVSQLQKSINQMGDRLLYIINKTTFQKNELQAMVNSMIESVILLDEDLKIKKMNSAAESLTGKSLDQCKGENISRAFENQIVVDIIQRAYSSSEVQQETVCLNQALEQYVQVFSSPILNSDGDKAGILLVMNDITRTKKLENTRKEFVSNVSHELKTPITLINGYVETLLDGAVKDEKKLIEFLSIIGKHSKRLNAIIADLLILSNIEDKGSAIETEDVYLYDLLFSAYTSALESARKEEISIKIICYEKLQVSVNPNLLEQAVFNLISNAVKYAGKGSSILITGRLTLTDEEKRVEIIVEDDGMGIEKEQLDRIFERFYRIDKSQKKKTAGTGLGLSIVKHIVLAHKGHISVDSNIGRGVRFTISLPASHLTEP